MTEHSETCRCGADVSVKDDDPARVREQIESWRGSHLCLPKGGQSGSTCGVIGFHATPGDVRA